MPSMDTPARDDDLARPPRQDIQELHIGLLNMMPDAALRVTEQQFIRLVGGANASVQVHVHPFTVSGLERSPEAEAYIAARYETFEQLREDGLDALIVSGANVVNPALENEAFYEPLRDVTDWANAHVTSVLCSCLATHALLQQRHGIRRRRLLSKRWGVYPHVVRRPDHPLLLGTNTLFDVPHSRWNEVTVSQLEAAGLEVLISSTEGDVHLATDPDGFRTVYLQGHPEYDAVSLLKEYKRDVTRYLEGGLDGIPPVPENYLSEAAARRAHDYVEEALAARARGRPLPEFPEDELAAGLHNTWTDTAKAMFHNWLGLVYRLTGARRGVPLGPGLDPQDPLALRR
jgi:homoserine O-succinyltransferase/O-acetyltransferase